MAEHDWLEGEIEGSNQFPKGCMVGRNRLSGMSFGL